jgi:hypothetical protein
MADSLVLLPCRNLKIDEYGKRGGRQEMTGDGPREYELEYTTREAVGVRRRLGIDTERGSVTRFVLQLEHLVEVDGEQEWTTIVRYDHAAKGVQKRRTMSPKKDSTSTCTGTVRSTERTN